MSEPERPDVRDRSGRPDPAAAMPCGTSWAPKTADYPVVSDGGSGWGDPLPGPKPVERVMPAAYRVWAPARTAAP